MSRNPILQNKEAKVKKENHPIEILYKEILQNGVWIFGIPSWLFGIADRGVAAFADGYLSLVDILQVLTAFFLFMGWLCLKPGRAYDDNETVSPQNSGSLLEVAQQQYLDAAQTRMLELQDYHLVSQEYVLPFPYLCQIYHLLNLKHLEDVHSFSLNNLRVIKVSGFQSTDVGGMITFETVLDSPFNALRIWRKPVVEVELVLHTPYTVELRIPVYNGKKIIVIFNAIPLSANRHKLFIDIYSDLAWPRPILQPVLHLASCLTLFEDLPYLSKLAERNIHRLVSLGHTSSHETMKLFKRFVDLYGSVDLSQDQFALAGAASGA